MGFLNFYISLGLSPSSVFGPAVARSEGWERALVFCAGFPLTWMAHPLGTALTSAASEATWQFLGSWRCAFSRTRRPVGRASARRATLPHGTLPCALVAHLAHHLFYRCGSVAACTARGTRFPYSRCWPFSLSSCSRMPSRAGARPDCSNPTVFPCSSTVLRLLAAWSLPSGIRLPAVRRPTGLAHRSD